MLLDFACVLPLKHYIRLSLFFYILLLLCDISSGQECDKIMSKPSSFKVGKEFKQYNIFRSAFVDANAPILCCAYFLPDKNYLIIFRSDSKNKPLKFRLVEKNTNKVIFDNSKQNYIQQANFSVSDNPINITIEITVFDQGSLSEKSEHEKECAAFWIFMKKKSE